MRANLGTDQLTVALPDQRVVPIQERLWLRYPSLVRYEAMFVTAYVEPPWTGQLPDGTTGTTRHPLIQFIISSQHPRPLQRKFGIHHVSIATAWRNAWELAEQERGRFVQGGARDPAEAIFAALAQKHARDLQDLERIMD